MLNWIENKIIGRFWIKLKEYIVSLVEKWSRRYRWIRLRRVGGNGKLDGVFVMVRGSVNGVFFKVRVEEMEYEG